MEHCNNFQVENNLAVKTFLGAKHQSKNNVGKGQQGQDCGN